jgi:hypothetical protein
MKTIKMYESFNFRRYGNPWVAMVDTNGKLDFTAKVGGYTGGYNKGEAGELYISNPVDGAIYAYGQKDYRGNNSGYQYVVYADGAFNRVEKTELISRLSK